jgi:hypothetical protein
LLLGVRASLPKILSGAKNLFLWHFAGVNAAKDLL